MSAIGGFVEGDGEVGYALEGFHFTTTGVQFPGEKSGVVVGIERLFCAGGADVFLSLRGECHFIAHGAYGGIWGFL